MIDARDARRIAREKQLVLATSSHELRTPLNGMMTMLDMIEHDPAERNKYIRIARMSTRLMLSLVNDMLDLSSILSNEFKKKLGSFDIRKALNEAADLVRFMIEEKGLRLNVTIDRMVPRMAYTDKDRLTQVIINLLSNAYKYTLEGTIILRVSICMEMHTRMLLVQVTDTGIGIR